MHRTVKRIVSWPELGSLRTALSPHPPPLTHPTWVLATTAPLDETDDEQDQHQEGDGAHEPDEPALGDDVGLVVGVSCGEARSKHVKDLACEKVRRERGGKNFSSFTGMLFLEPHATS